MTDNCPTCGSDNPHLLNPLCAQGVADRFHYPPMIDQPAQAVTDTDAIELNVPDSTGDFHRGWDGIPYDQPETEAVEAALRTLKEVGSYTLYGDLNWQKRVDRALATITALRAENERLRQEAITAAPLFSRRQEREKFRALWEAALSSDLDDDDISGYLARRAVTDAAEALRPIMEER